MMPLENAVPLEAEDFVKVPILGNIPCGDLQLVGDGEIVGYEWLHKNILGKGEFLLRAKGNSMVPMITDGDLLIVQPGHHWNNRDVVAVWVDGEMTCKKLHLADNHALLSPVNPNYEPIIVT